MTSLGVQEMIVIFLVLLVLLGPKSPRQLGEEIGKVLQEFMRYNQRVRNPIRLSLADLALLALLFIMLVVIALWLSTGS